MMSRWLLAFALCLAPHLAVASLHDCYDATCRLHLSGHSGSGCVFAEDATHYYVLTNAHVTRKSDTPRLVFVMRGHERSVNGETVWHSYADISSGYHRDIAVVKVAKDQFAGYTPRIVPIAEADFALAENQEIASSGAPGGGYITGWKGHVTSVATDAFNFVPPPMGGRSGSAIFDRDGTKIIGLLAWGGGGEGTAQTIGEIHRAMRGEAAQVYDERNRVVPAPVTSPNEIKPLAPLADIEPRQQPWCPQCPPVGPSPIRPPARPPGQQPPPSQPPGDGGGMPFPLPPGVVPEPDAPEPQPPPSNPAPVQPAPTQPPVKGCECTGEGKCLCKPEDQCLCDGKDVAALQARITILEAQIAAICQQIEPSKLAPQIEPHLKPFRIRVVPPSGYTDTEPPYSAVRLGQRVDLKLEPVPKAK